MPTAWAKRAPDRTRTCTSGTLDPKSSASTSSATGAYSVSACKDKHFFAGKERFSRIFLSYSCFFPFLSCKNYFTLPTEMRYSAIWTALRAAPLRIWSPLSQKVRPFSSLKSLRTRPTNTSSLPAVSSGMG